jgi:hypothetical protein
MWWECSECGASTEQARAPVRCSDCGTAGVIFVAAQPELEGEPHAMSLRDAWLRLGLERPPTVGLR